MTNSKLVTLETLQKDFIPWYSQKHIRYLGESGVIPREQKLGRFWLYDPDKVIAALKNHKETRKSNVGPVPATDELEV